MSHKYIHAHETYIHVPSIYTCMDRDHHLCDDHDHDYLPLNSLFDERMKIKRVTWKDERESFSNERETH